MRTVKKITSILLLVLICLSTLVSCHGIKEQPNFVLPEEFDTTKNYEITFWAKNENIGKQVEIYKKAVEDFQEIYPNITVNIKFYTNYADIYNDVITNISTNTTPNICITYPDHIATYISREDTVVELDELLYDKKYGLGGSEVNFDSPTANEIIPEFLDECRLGGHYYALPFMRSTEACYVNKTYVEALGFTLPETLTWDFVWEVSEAATKKDENGNFLINGQKTLIPFIYKSTDNMMIQMLAQKNAGYSTELGDILIFNEQTEDILYEISEHTSTRAFSTFKREGYPANFLNAGQCIFAIDSTGGATWMGSDAPLVDIPEESMVDFEIEVMTVPQYDTENPKMISQGPSACIFNKEDPQEVLASWLFLQYLLTNDVQIAYSSTEGYIPVTSLAQNSDEYKDYLSRAGEDNQTYYDVKIKASKMLIENTENTFVTPVFNGSASLRDASGHLIESVVKSIRRKETVDSAYIEKLFDDTASLYRLDSVGENSSDYRRDLGPMPRGSLILLSVLCIFWVSLAVIFSVKKLKKSKKR